MVSTNSFKRVLTHVLLPIAAIYLLSVGLDVTEADIGYVADKPTLLSRTPPFIPGERFFFRREAKNTDNNNDNYNDNDNDDEKAEAAEPTATSSGGSSRGSSIEDDAKNEDDDERPSKDTADDDKEDAKDKEKSGEGSRHGFLSGLRGKKRKQSKLGPFPPSPRPTITQTAAPTAASTRVPEQVTTAGPTLTSSSTASPADTTGFPASSTTEAPFPVSLTGLERTNSTSPKPVCSLCSLSTTPASVNETTTVRPSRTAHLRPGFWVYPAESPIGPTKKAHHRPYIYHRSTTRSPPSGPTTTATSTLGPGSSTAKPFNGTVSIFTSTASPSTTLGPNKSTGSPSGSPTPFAGITSKPSNGTGNSRRPHPRPLIERINATSQTTPKMSTTTLGPQAAITTTTTSTTPEPRRSSTSSLAPSTPSPSQRPSTSAAPTNEPTQQASTSPLPSTSPFPSVAPTELSGLFKLSSVKPNQPITSTTKKPADSTTESPTKPSSSSSTTIKPSPEVSSTTGNPARSTTGLPAKPSTSTSTSKPIPKVIITTTLPTAQTNSSTGPALPTISPTTPSKVGTLPPPTQAAKNSTIAQVIFSNSIEPGLVAIKTNDQAAVFAQRASMNATAVINGEIYAIVNNPNITRSVANPDAELLLGFNRTLFDARDVAYFLESHPAHSIQDPRVYFTGERTTRSLVILLRELSRLPERLRFAYMVRVFNELGRKIASKLNYFAIELVAVLRKSPDQLGNKPEVSMLVDAIHNAFEGKDDGEISGQAEIELEFDNYTKRIVESSKEKSEMFMAAMSEISNRFAQIISYFVLKTTSTEGGGQTPLIRIPSGGHEKKLAIILGESLKSGAKAFILETAYDDRFRIPLDSIGYVNVMLNETISMTTKRLEDKNMNVSESIRRDFDESMMNTNSFKDLNPISDKIGLIGSWNSFLFSNLGTAERLVKVFSSLLSRVPPEIKVRWINMYVAQIYLELERTISAFVAMQGMPFHANASETFLLDPEKTIELIPNKVPTIRDNYLADKNRIPARCYLAGRRWRLVLSRGLEKFADKDAVIDSLANRIGAIKNRMMDQNGNDIYRLCLPRLEVGIRGWGIDGNPGGADTSKNTDKFPLKNPIEGLTEMKDPFASGVMLGFGIGVRLGYNEERNATLEMERANHLQIGSNEFNHSLGLSEVNYVAMASYRRAATVGGRKAFEIAVREGYLASLKISVRAGMLIPVEAGSRISALKAVSFAGQAGQEAGKAAAEAFILDRKLSDVMKINLIRVGQTHGLLAGEIAGESIGSIVGKAAAEEAYRRSIIRGGKVARAKFHLEEFEAGARLGFEYGLGEGKRIASSSTLDPSAPRFFRLPKPVFSDQDKSDNEVDHWEKELIPTLTDTIIEKLASVRDHTPVRGTLKGTYKVVKETKKGFKRISYSNVTYDLEVFAQGFIQNSIAYLTLNGTVNKMGVLRGSLIARDIFNDDQDE